MSKPFKLHSAFSPSGDQPVAIARLKEGLEDGVAQVLALKEQGMRLKDAAKEVAEHTGLSKNELYAAALER